MFTVMNLSVKLSATDALVALVKWQVSSTQGAALALKVGEEGSGVCHAVEREVQSSTVTFTYNIGLDNKC